MFSQSFESMMSIMLIPPRAFFRTAKIQRVSHINKYAEKIIHSIMIVAPHLVISVIPSEAEGPARMFSRPFDSLRSLRVTIMY